MSPYSLRGGLGVVWRHFFPNLRCPPDATFCPQSAAISPDAGEHFRIGLLGDIMDVGGQPLAAEDAVTEFFADCDAVVGNLEAVIAPPKRHPQQQRHHERIIGDLASHFPLHRLWLSVANNHAADFGHAVFAESVAQLRGAGIQVFGTREHPFAELTRQVRVITGSAWTNMPCDAIADIDHMHSHVDPECFHLFYPHWGYEMECAPRREILQWGHDLLKLADAVVGHHSHLPQPVQVKTVDGRHKVLATSLGNFCARYRRGASRSYRYGIILKIILGGSVEGRPPAIAGLEWRFVESHYSSSGVRVGLRDSVPFFVTR